MRHLLLTACLATVATSAVAEEAIVRIRTDAADPIVEIITASNADGSFFSVETFRQSVVVTLTYVNDAPISDAEWAEVHESVHVCEEGKLVNLAAETLPNGVRWMFDCIWGEGAL